MLKWAKRQWWRLHRSWEAFKREWRFNFQDRADNKLVGKPFWLMGMGRLRNPCLYQDDSFDMRPPYYGMPLVRVDGQVFTLKYVHYNPATGIVRYLDTDKPEDGFGVLQTSGEGGWHIGWSSYVKPEGGKNA